MHMQRLAVKGSRTLKSLADSLGRHLTQGSGAEHNFGVEVSVRG